MTMLAARAAFCSAVVVTALLVNSTLLPRLALPGATPNLVLLAVVAFALAYGRLTGAVVGFAAGLAVDLVPPAVTAVGRWALVLCLVGYVAGAAGRAGRRLWASLAIVGVATVATLVLFAASGELAGDGVVPWSAVAHLVPFAVLYNACLAPVVVVGLLSLTRRLDSAPRGGRAR